MITQKRMVSIHWDCGKGHKHKSKSLAQRCLDIEVDKQERFERWKDRSVVLHRAVLDWFDGKKPEAMSYEEHLQQPTVNCTDETDRDLAWAVAAYLLKREEEVK